MVKLKRGPGNYGAALSEIQARQRDHAQRTLQLEALRRRFKPLTSYLEGNRPGSPPPRRRPRRWRSSKRSSPRRPPSSKSCGLRPGRWRTRRGGSAVPTTRSSPRSTRFKQRRRQLVATCEGRFAEDAHEQLDASLAGHRAAFDAHASRPDWRFADRLVQSYVLGRDPAFAKALHDAVDSRTDFASGTRDGYRTQRDRLAREVGRRRYELDLRAQEQALEGESYEQAKTAAADRLAAALAHPVTT